MGGLVSQCLSGEEARKQSEVSLERVPSSQKESTARKIISFKDFKGFKKTDDIRKMY